MENTRGVSIPSVPTYTSDSGQGGSIDVPSTMPLDSLLKEIGVKDQGSFLHLADLGPCQDFNYVKREDQGGRIVLDPGQGVEKWVDTLVEMGELEAALTLANMMGGTDHKDTLIHLFGSWAKLWPERASEAIHVAVKLASSGPCPDQLLLGLAEAANFLGETPLHELSTDLARSLEKACDELLDNGGLRPRDARNVTCCAHARDRLALETLLSKGNVDGALALFNRASDIEKSRILENLIVIRLDPERQPAARYLFNAVPPDVVKKCLDGAADHARERAELRDLFNYLIRCRAMFRGIEVAAGLVALAADLFQDLLCSEAITDEQFVIMSVNLVSAYDVVHPELLRQVLGVADPQSFLQETNRDARGCTITDAQQRLDGLMGMAPWRDLVDKLVGKGHLQSACALAFNCGPGNRTQMLVHFIEASDKSSVAKEAMRAAVDAAAQHQHPYRVLAPMAEVANLLTQAPLRQEFRDVLVDACHRLFIDKRLCTHESAGVLHRVWERERLAILDLSRNDMDGARALLSQAPRSFKINMIGVLIMTRDEQGLVHIKELFVGMEEEEKKDILESALSNAGRDALERQQVLDLVAYLKRCHDLFVQAGPADDFAALIRNSYEELSNFKWVAMHEG